MVQYAYQPPHLSQDVLRTSSSFLRTVILICIAAAAMASREFAVVRFESIIHECVQWGYGLQKSRTG